MLRAGSVYAFSVVELGQGVRVFVPQLFSNQLEEVGEYFGGQSPDYFAVILIK